jgi:hypothetical protein
MDKHATIGLNVILISGLCLFLLFGILVITGVFANVLTPGGDNVNLTVGSETNFILTVNNRGVTAGYFKPISFVVGTKTYTLTASQTEEKLIDSGANGTWEIPISFDTSFPWNVITSVAVTVVGRGVNPDVPQTETKTVSFVIERLNPSCLTNTCNGVFNRYDVNGCPIWRVG